MKESEKIFNVRASIQALKENQFIFDSCNTIIVNDFIAGRKK